MYMFYVMVHVISHIILETFFFAKLSCIQFFFFFIGWVVDLIDGI